MGANGRARRTCRVGEHLSARPLSRRKKRRREYGREEQHLSAEGSWASRGGEETAQGMEGDKQKAQCHSIFDCVLFRKEMVPPLSTFHACVDSD